MQKKCLACKMQENPAPFDPVAYAYVAGAAERAMLGTTAITDMLCTTHKDAFHNRMNAIHEAILKAKGVPS
jgi:hypothetical protein